MIVREHVLKTTPDMWRAVQSGEKNFEVRRDDRGFQRGDILVLHRLSVDTFGNVSSTYVDYRDKRPVELRRKIKWILTGGQLGVEPGYVVMALGDVDE